MKKLNRSANHSDKVSEIVSFNRGSATSGVLGFTVSYRDGTFQNIILPYDECDYAAVEARIIQLKKQYSGSFDPGTDEQTDTLISPKANKTIIKGAFYEPHPVFYPISHSAANRFCCPGWRYPSM
jgi:hypothetical protein